MKKRMPLSAFGFFQCLAPGLYGLSGHSAAHTVGLESEGEIGSVTTHPRGGVDRLVREPHMKKKSALK